MRPRPRPSHAGTRLHRHRRRLSRRHRRVRTRAHLPMLQRVGVRVVLTHARARGVGTHGTAGAWVEALVRGGVLHHVCWSGAASVGRLLDVLVMGVLVRHVWGHVWWHGRVRLAWLAGEGSGHWVA